MKNRSEIMNKKGYKNKEDTKRLNQIYKILLKNYGYQGWWPLLDVKGSNPTKTGWIKGYHPKDYNFPKNDAQRFEIIVGAILTQNTSWVQVEKALLNLKKKSILSYKGIIEANIEDIKLAIKPAGYFNQKAERLKTIAEWFSKKIENKSKPTRQELLKIKGVGKETADSILLYAYSIPEFIADAYTRRIANRIFGIKEDYDEVKEFFERNLKKDFKIWQEYHALLVEHAKRYCQKKPKCEGCVLNSLCNFSTEL